MSAECSKCGSDITYPEGTWPVGRCARCDAYDEKDAWKALALDMGDYIEAVRGACLRSGIPTKTSSALLARLSALTNPDEKEPT